jgi:soluble cytochrome b562
MLRKNLRQESKKNDEFEVRGLKEGMKEMIENLEIDKNEKMD